MINLSGNSEKNNSGRKTKAVVMTKIPRHNKDGDIIPEATLSIQEAPSLHSLGFNPQLSQLVPFFLHTASTCS